jgi:hypothetical protein
MSTPASDLMELLYLFRERGWPVLPTIKEYAARLIAAGLRDELGGC